MVPRPSHALTLAPLNKYLQYASIHFERRLHNPKSFFTQNITLLPHLFVHAIPIAQPPRSGFTANRRIDNAPGRFTCPSQQSAAGAQSIQPYRFLNIYRAQLPEAIPIRNEDIEFSGKRGVP